MQFIPAVRSKTLTSLALMDTNLLTKDYLSTFLPFIATLVLKRKYDSIELGVIVNDFKEEYGLSIPRAPMRSILSKATTAGLLKLDRTAKYLPNITEIQKIAFSDKQRDTSMGIYSICIRFSEFTKQKHGITISEDEATQALIGFLDEYSPKTISGDTDDISKDYHISHKNLFLMGEFIKSVHAVDVPLFEAIRKLALAYLIATALTYDIPVENRTQEFANLTIYLDTPIVLRLLGLQTEELKNACEEMIASLTTTIKPTYMIFQHTLDEISGIISDCAYWLENPAYNPLYANQALLSFIEKRFTKTQIELYLKTLEDTIIYYGIQVDRDEYYNIANDIFHIDSRVLETKLVEAYIHNNPHYDKDKHKTSIRYDIMSIENIVKLWGNKTSSKYSSLGYLFLTNNSTFAYICRKFTEEYWWDKKNHKSPCVTDYYLGTMVWLSVPIERVEGFSQLKLLADCSAATALSREVMEKFLSALKCFKESKGINDGDFLLIRQYVFEKNYLQNITLNEEDAFKEDTIDQLLEDIKNDIQKPLIDSINEKNKEIEVLKSINDEKAQVVKEFEDANESAKLKRASEDEEIIRRSESLVNGIANIYMPIATAAIALFSICIGAVSFEKLNIINISLGIVVFMLALLTTTLKYNIFNIRNLFLVKVKKHYKVKQFKETISV